MRLKVTVSSTCSNALVWFAMLCSMHGQSVAQTSGQEFRRAGFIDANNVKMVHGNWGVLGQPGESGSRGAWPFATNGYIGDLSFLIGAELPGLPITAHSVVGVAVSRPGTPDMSQTGKSWTFEPVDGFSNPVDSRIAVSTDPSTWPAAWPDHPDWKGPGGEPLWNGLGGPGVFVADQESFYIVDDSNDERYSYFLNNDRGIEFKPDSINPFRNGLGLRVAVRHLEWNHPLLKDALFSVYDITNEGTQTYGKIVFGQLNGTYVGVTSSDYSQNEYDDDVSLLFHGPNIVLTRDFTPHMRNPLWVGPNGMLGHGFVATPVGEAIASYHGFIPAANIRFDDDESLWQKLTPGYFGIPVIFADTLAPEAGADADYIMGSGYFTLAPGDTQRVVTILAYGYSKEEVEQKVEIARAFWNRGFDMQKVYEAVTLNSFEGPTTLQGTVSINWSSGIGNGTVGIWFSPDHAKTWKPVATGLPHQGSYSWNTALQADCSFGTIRLLARDSTGKMQGFDESTANIIVDNASNGSPTLFISQQQTATPVVFEADSIQLSLLLGDPEGQPLLIRAYYQTEPGGSWTLFDYFARPGEPSECMLTFRVRDLPNAPRFSILLEASDGVFVTSDSTIPFIKQSQRIEVERDRVVHASGASESPFGVRVIDRAKLTGDEYVVSFDDSSNFPLKTVEVWNRTKNGIALSPAILVSNVESPAFDGLVFWANDTVTHVPASGLRLNRSVPPNTFISCQVTNIYPGDYPQWVRGFPAANDYVIVFSDSIVTASIANDALFLPSQPVNFRVFERSSMRSIPFSGYVQEGIMEILLIEGGPGDFGFTWDVLLVTPPLNPPLKSGDSLFITTSKGFSARDTVVISGTLVAGVERREDQISSFVLAQNYPNPFNPQTRISYVLYSTSRVSLKIYDLLGREIVELVGKDMPAGHHSVTWKPAHLASGMYFYRFEAIPAADPSTRCVNVKKMVLLR